VQERGVTFTPGDACVHAFCCTAVGRLRLRSCLAPLTRAHTHTHTHTHTNTQTHTHTHTYTHTPNVRAGQAFYRAESAQGRDLAVLAAALQRRTTGRLRVLDVMAGSGMRGARYLTQVCVCVCVCVVLCCVVLCCACSLGKAEGGCWAAARGWGCQQATRRCHACKLPQVHTACTLHAPTTTATHVRHNTGAGRPGVVQ
jgi:hypothetical protein